MAILCIWRSCDPEGPRALRVARSGSLCKSFSVKTHMAINPLDFRFEFLVVFDR